MLLIFFSCNDENEKFAERQEINTDKQAVCITEKEDLSQYEAALAAVKRFDLTQQNIGKVSTRSLDLSLSEINVISVEESVYSFNLEEITNNQPLNNGFGKKFRFRKVRQR
jgi:hypothetical protein